MFVTVNASMTVCVQVKWRKEGGGKKNVFPVHFMRQHNIEITLLRKQPVLVAFVLTNPLISATNRKMGGCLVLGSRVVVISELTVSSGSNISSNTTKVITNSWLIFAGRSLGGVGWTTCCNDESNKERIRSCRKRTLFPVPLSLYS